MRSRIILFSVVLFLLAFVPVSSAVIIADSVDDFGSTQGLNGWNYQVKHSGGGGGYDMTWNAGTSMWEDVGLYGGSAPYTALMTGDSQTKHRFGGPVNAGVYTYRVWTTDVPLTDLSLQVDYDFLHARALVYQTISGSRNYIGEILNGAGSGTKNFAMPDMAAGDSFEIQFGPWSVTTGDGVLQLCDLQLTGVVVPEPATIALLGLGGLLLRRKR